MFLQILKMQLGKMSSCSWADPLQEWGWKVAKDEKTVDVVGFLDGPLQSRVGEA